MNRRTFLRSGVLTTGAGIVGLPRLTATGAGVALPIRLNANENAIGMSPLARQVIRESIEEANRYPFESGSLLVESICHLHDSRPDQVLLGNGSSEILRLLVAALAPESPLILTAQPGYEAVGGQGDVLSLPVDRVPLRRDFAHDLNRMNQSATKYDGPTLVYICNPNNPTGTLTPDRELREWIDRAPPKTTFLIDEAYFHFVKDPRYGSLTDLAKERPNVVVTRTFSKVYAMAGMRMGYCIAHPDLVRRMSRLTHLNVNLPAIVAARASLGDQQFLKQSIESNARSKQILLEELSRLGIPWLESHTNFVMFRIQGETAQFASRMKERGILVGRPFPPMTDHNRVSLGRPEEMEHFAETLRAFREQGWV
jgi:histidinol-phosphate aminotransferase